MPLLRLKLEGSDLTAREIKVLRLTAHGFTRTEIAEKLGVSSETIKDHSKCARARLGARTNAHAVALALTFDLI